MKNLLLHVINGLLIVMNIVIMIYTIVELNLADSMSIQIFFVSMMSFIVIVYEVVTFMIVKTYRHNLTAVIIKYIPIVVIFALYAFLFMAFGVFNSMNHIVMFYLISVMIAATVFIVEIALKKSIANKA